MTRQMLKKKFKEYSLKRPSFRDSVDAEVNRRVAQVKPDKASILDSVFALGAIVTFVADIVTDALVAKQHFENDDILWFSLTCIFIVLPSLVMQIFSCKWFEEDSENETWWNYLVHFLQLGTIHRYLQTFWYGICTRNSKKKQDSYYIRYLAGWRDICLLRLFEGFLEAAPQMILQLYILTVQNEFIAKRDWLTATSAVVSIISLSWAIVSYSQMLRLCLDNKALSIFGYFFQVLYRLLMVASRVVALVLFASAFKYYIFIVVGGHLAMMFGWLSCMDMISRSTDRSNDRNDESHEELFLDKVFTLIVSVIYVFCFFKVRPSTTNTEISLYYGFVFIETGILMAVWFPYKTLDGILMYAAFGLVFGGFVVGLAFMLLYYRFFHPKEDVTASWLCCPLWARRSANCGYPIISDSSLSVVENRDIVIINQKEKEESTTELTTSESKNDLGIPLELIRPHSPSKGERKANGEEDKIFDPADGRQEHAKYGTMDASSSTTNSRKTRHVLDDENANGIPEMKGNRRDHQRDDLADGGTVKEEAPKHRWVARVSKKKVFNQFDDKAELLGNKTELANLHFNQLRAVESVEDERENGSNITQNNLHVKASWQVELSNEGKRQREETPEHLDIFQVIARPQSKDDSEVYFGGVPKRGNEKTDWRRSVDDKTIIKANLSSLIANEEERSL